MKTATILTAALIASTMSTGALADPGHFAESQGHSHWLAAGALALAAVIGGVALWRRRRARKAERRA